MIPGPAPLHHMSPTWSPGPLGFLGPGDSDLQKQSRAHSNTNPRWFPWQKSHDFWCWDKGDWLEALPYLGFLTSITWKFRKRNPEIANLPTLVRSSTFSSEIPYFLQIVLKFFLSSGLPSGFLAVGKVTITAVSYALVTEVPGGGVGSPERWGNGCHWWLLRQKSWGWVWLSQIWQLVDERFHHHPITEPEGLPTVSMSLQGRRHRSG